MSKLSVALIGGNLLLLLYRVVQNFFTKSVLSISRYQVAENQPKFDTARLKGSLAIAEIFITNGPRSLVKQPFEQRGSVFQVALAAPAAHSPLLRRPALPASSGPQYHPK